jgi:hypothetical protein
MSVFPAAQEAEIRGLQSRLAQAKNARPYAKNN